MPTVETARRSLAVLTAVLLIASLVPRFAQASETPLVPVLIQLEDEPLASYRGGVSGLPPTSPEATGQRRVDPTSAASRRYLAHLDGRIARFEQQLHRQVPGAMVGGRFEIVLGGVSARVPADRLDAVRQLPGVVAVTRDEPRELLTDRVPSFVGADTAWQGLGGQDDAGEGVIVGVIDTGIWPEHPSFSDPDPAGEGFPSPPQPATGSRDCDFGSSDPDDVAFVCNNKLIGAYRFMSGWERWEGDTGGFASARDNDGHGTHTASTAAGNGGVEARLGGHSLATVSGIAPRAHVIAYKVCGTNSDSSGACYVSDSVDAVEQAVLDGVDVINFSISGGEDPYTDPVEQAFQDAYAAGTVVVAAAGNSGPTADTVAHRGPWTLTVGASTHDRSFTSTVTLAGVGATLPVELTGTSVTSGISLSTPVVNAAAHGNELCKPNVWSATEFSGEIVVCKRGQTPRVSKSEAVEAAGGGGMLLYNVAGGDAGTYADLHAVPSVHLDVAEGEVVLDFLASNTAVTGTFPGGAGDLIGRGDGMARSSSRGGSGQPLGISKPDVTAPGVNILAGYTPSPNHPNHPDGETFSIASGTSMSSPVTAGAAALLVDQHPDWAPGRIRSALMTTATDAVTNHDGAGTTTFDRGSGRVDLTRSADPGLTFDATAADYDTLRDRLWEANHPSLYHPNAGGTFRVQRTVRSHLPTASTWTASLVEPSGVKLDVPASVEVAAGGTATIDLAANVRALEQGVVRDARLELRDGTGRIVAFPITLVKGTDPANTAPVASSSSLRTRVDTSTDIHLEATDADDDLLEYSVVAPPDHGTLSGSAPHLTYTPAPGYVGSDSFVFEVDDGAATSNTAMVSIDVSEGEADLTVSLADAPDPVEVGDSLSYETSVTNAGPDAASGVRLTLDLPAQVSSPSVTSGACIVSSTSPEITCEVGDLPVGSTSTVEVVATAAVRASGATAVADAVLDQVDPIANPVSTTTLIAERPAAPRSVSASAGDRTATVTWAAPTDDGGSAIGSYTVTSSPGGKTMTVGGAKRSASVTGLANGTSYSFKVTATNAIGTGPASAASNAVTPAGQPGAPADVSATAADAKATVSWSAADPDGSAVTSYTVRSSPGGKSVTVDGSERSATVTGLTNGTAYTFTVTATNQVGTGPGSTSDEVLPGVRLDGDPRTTERIDHGDAISAAVELSRARFAHDRASHVVLSRHDTFADSLAGAALTDRGPLLLTPSGRLASTTRSEIDRVLPGGGTVFILGGNHAVGPSVEEALRNAGYRVVRLFGATRIETALKVADEVRRQNPGEQRVAIARAFGPDSNPSAAWADSVTGGAWAAETGVPIVVTTGDRLHDSTAAWLRADGPSRTILLGGTAALSDAVAAAVPSPKRVFGATRDGTAAAIATELWGSPTSGSRKHVIIHGWRTDGWAFGLAAAGLAARQDAPLLLVHPNEVPGPTAQLVSSCGTPQVDLLLIGSASVISDDHRRQLDALDGGDC